MKRLLLSLFAAAALFGTASAQVVPDSTKTGIPAVSITGKTGTGSTFVTDTAPTISSAALTSPISSNGTFSTPTFVNPTSSGGTLTTPTLALSVVKSYTFGTLTASFPASSYPGSEVWVSDIGANGAKLRSDGSRWKAPNGRILLKLQAANSSNVANSNTIIMQTLLPAGFVQAGDVFIIREYMTKSGSTDTALDNVYLGTAGTTSDTSLLASTTMTASNLSVGIERAFAVVSVTSIQRVGAGTPGAGSLGAQNTTAPPAAVTVSSLTSNAMYLSFSIQNNGNTNTVQLQAGSYIEIITN